MNKKSLFKCSVFLLIFMVALCLPGRNIITFAAQKISSGTYYLVSKLDSNYCLAVSEGSNHLNPLPQSYKQ